MAIRLPRIIQAKQILKRSSSFKLNNNASSVSVPKGHFTVYVGESEQKRHVIPIAYLQKSSFQELLSLAEQEFGFDHPTGGLTIPCSEEMFIRLTSSLQLKPPVSTIHM